MRLRWWMWKGEKSTYLDDRRKKVTPSFEVPRDLHVIKRDDQSKQSSGGQLQTFLLCRYVLIARSKTPVTT